MYHLKNIPWNQFIVGRAKRGQLSVRHHHRYTPLGDKRRHFFCPLPKNTPSIQVLNFSHFFCPLTTTTKDLSYYSVFLVLNFSHFFCPLTFTTKDLSYYSVLLVQIFCHFFCPLLNWIYILSLARPTEFRPLWNWGLDFSSSLVKSYFHEIFLEQKVVKWALLYRTPHYVDFTEYLYVHKIHEII